MQWGASVRLSVTFTLHFYCVKNVSFLFRIYQNLQKRRSNWCWIKVPGRLSPTRLPLVCWGKLSLRRAKQAWSTWGTPATWTASSRPFLWPQSESFRHKICKSRCSCCEMKYETNFSFSFFSFRRHVLSLHLNGSNTLMKKLQLLFAFLAHTQVSVALLSSNYKHC